MQEDTLQTLWRKSKMVTALKRPDGSVFYLCDYCEKEAFGSNDMSVVLDHEDVEHSNKEKDK